jgi:hypothetical protein
MDTAPTTTSPRPWPRRHVACAAVAAAVLLTVPACSRTLYREGDIRSQYDRYDAARGNDAPMFITDEFGVRTPNLSGRLRPELDR